MITSLRRHALLASVLMLGVLTATACGQSDASPTTSGATVSAAADARTGYPADVTNCGRTLHFDRAPTRIVSGWTTSTELLLELGVGDRIVGRYNTGSGTPSPAYADAEQQIPVIGESAPTKEALIAAHPDLIWADGDYLFDGQQLPTIDQLAAEGIQVMILSGFCTDDATRATVRDVETDLDALGRILGIAARANQVKAGIEDQLDAVAQQVGGATSVPVAMISTSNKTIYAYAGVYSDIAALAGARNIYADTLPEGKYYNEISTEDLIRQNPSTIVYMLSGTETTDSAQSYLSATLPTVDAVTTGHVVFLPASDSTNLAGVAGVVKLAAALHP